jgi:hypothetical protein
MPTWDEKRRNPNTLNLLTEPTATEVQFPN